MSHIKFDPKKGIWCDDEETVEKLRKNFFGTVKKGKVFLQIEEALYLMNFQNIKCYQKKKEIGFNELVSHFIGKEPRLFIRYNAYRDWRDRGLVVERLRNLKGQTTKTQKRYPSKNLEMEPVNSEASWFPESLFSVIEDEKTGKRLFEKHWIGQLGIYKQTRGSLLKLNFLETVFLGRQLEMKITLGGKDVSAEKILEDVAGKREYARALYDVYEDWRLRSYVVKTGFKFGSHFRIYFPGASPVGVYKHSKHVLHVFPKDQKLLISEWARAVRVAHSVKKTFLLGIPEMTKDDFVDQGGDFLAYRRKKEKGSWIRETPKNKPRYLLVAVSEDDHIGGTELASLLRRARSMGVELLLSITDRETAITYYVLKKIMLPGSKYEYYEIEWMKP